MTNIRRTTEQQTALAHIQSAINSHPDASHLLDDFAEMLADVPVDDLDREINNVGHVLMLTLKKTAPDLSDSMQYVLPFAFVEMLRERMAH